MRYLKHFSSIIFIGVIAAVVMATVSAQAQHIFPWPSARCPVRWHHYEGRYRIGAEIVSPYNGHVIVLDVEHTQPGMEYMQIRQYDRNDQLYAEGGAYLPVGSSSLREVMRMPSTNQSYMVELNAYAREPMRDCDGRNLIVGISFYPLNAYRVEVTPQYVLVPLE